MDDEIGGCYEMNENDGKIRFQLRAEERLRLRQSKETNPATSNSGKLWKVPMTRHGAERLMMACLIGRHMGNGWSYVGELQAPALVV